MENGKKRDPMKNLRTLTLMIVLFLIISLACLETTITPIVDPTPSGDGISAPSAVDFAKQSPASLSENPAGAVFTIPEEWNEIPRGAPVQTRKPHKIEVGEIRECLAVAGVCR